MSRVASAGSSDHVRHDRDRKPSATASLKSYNAIADSCLAESLQDIPGCPIASRLRLLLGRPLWKTHSVASDHLQASGQSGARLSVEPEISRRAVALRFHAPESVAVCCCFSRFSWPFNLFLAAAFDRLF